MRHAHTGVIANSVIDRILVAEIKEQENNQGAPAVCPAHYQVFYSTKDL